MVSFGLFYTSLLENTIPMQAKSILLFLFSFCYLSFSYGQNYSIEGRIVDDENLVLPSATVMLAQASDSLLISFTITNNEGEFEMKRVPAGEYVLQVTYVGFASLIQPIILKGTETEFILGDLVMKQSSDLLNEVVVEADRIPILIKQDTIVYNADAFQTQAHDVVEDLLEKLPGVEVDRDGSIRAMGEDVTRVLVDGKEFFGNDPQIATKNLPADAIKQIEVFDKKSDMAEFSGIDDGETEKTINLKLKKDKKKGYFGAIEGGYGTDHRFRAKGNLNRFSGKVQYSLLGNANNINENGFSMRDYMDFMGGMGRMMSGGFRQMRNGSNNVGVPLGLNQEEGFRTSGSGGINLNAEVSEKTDVNVSYFFNRLKNISDAEISRENFLSDGSSFSTEETNSQLSQTNNHRLNTNWDFELDSMQDLKWRLGASFAHSTFADYSESYNFADSTFFESGSQSAYDSQNQNFSVDNNLVYRRKFNKKGRTFVGELGLGYEQDDLEGNLDYQNQFLADPNLISYIADTVGQRQTQDNNLFNYEASASFVEPIGKRRYLEFKASREQLFEELDKAFYDRDAETIGEELNTRLTGVYNRGFAADRVGMRFKKNKKKYQFTAGADYQHTWLKGTSSLNPTIQKQFHHILPFLSYRLDFKQAKNYRVTYSARINQPSIDQLQPILDNTDPLNRYLGNPNLKPEYSHTVRQNLLLVNQFSFSNFFAMISATYTKDKIINSRSVDAAFRQVTSPVNVDNDWRIFTTARFSTPIKPLKIRVSVGPRVTYNRTANLVNDILSYANNINGTFDFNFDNRDKEKFDLRIGTKQTLNYSNYTDGVTPNQSFVNQQYYLDASVNLPADIIVGTEFDYYVYPAQGFSSAFQLPLWKASIRKYFLESRKLMIKLSANDLLNQNQGITRTATSNYIEEERLNSLGRYFMLTVGYSISGFKSRKGGRGGMRMIMHGE